MIPACMAMRRTNIFCFCLLDIWIWETKMTKFRPEQTKKDEGEGKSLHDQICLGDLQKLGFCRRNFKYNWSLSEQMVKRLHTLGVVKPRKWVHDYLLARSGWLWRDIQEVEELASVLDFPAPEDILQYMDTNVSYWDGNNIFTVHYTLLSILCDRWNEVFGRAASISIQYYSDWSSWDLTLDSDEIYDEMKEGTKAPEKILQYLLDHGQLGNNDDIWWAVQRFTS